MKNLPQHQLAPRRKTPGQLYQHTFNEFLACVSKHFQNQIDLQIQQVIIDSHHYHYWSTVSHLQLSWSWTASTMPSSEKCQRFQHSVLVQPPTHAFLTEFVFCPSPLANHIVPSKFWKVDLPQGNPIMTWSVWNTEKLYYH